MLSVPEQHCEGQPSDGSLGEQEHATNRSTPRPRCRGVYALLLGVVLHSVAGFLQDFPIPAWADTPSTTAAVIYYVIHIFRMSAFFLMAGFFARIVVERRCVKAFVKDRAKRIGVPLFLFGPLVLAVFVPAGFVLGALAHGVDYLQSPGAPAQS